MKILSAFILLVLLFINPKNASAQACDGALFSDDFSTPGLWQTMGIKIFSWGAPGDVAISGGVTKYDNFRGRQTYRLTRSLNGALLNQTDWRMEFDFVLNASQTLTGAMLMAVTANNQHPWSATSGSTIPTHNSGIQVKVLNPLSSPGPNGDFIVISAKIGTTAAGSSPNIGINRGVRYYVRLERLSSQDWALSLFTDPARSIAVSGSPVCLHTGPGMEPLNFLHQAVIPVSANSRFMHGETDNICIFGDVLSDGCLPVYPCDIDAGIQYTTDGNCFFQFVNSSSAGVGNTLFGYSLISFGDGSSARLAPGQIVSHTYASSGTYQVCLRAFGHNSNMECCEDEICLEVNADCGGEFEFGKKVPVQPGSLEIFPNPSAGEFTLKSDKPFFAVAICDLSGRRLLQLKNQGTTMQMDLRQLPPGTYVLEAELEGELVRRKISIQQ